MTATESNWGVLFGDWLERDGRTKGLRPLRAQTLAGYQQDVRHLVRWCAARGLEFEPGLLTTELVRAYFDEQAQAGAAPKSMNRRLASLRVLVRWAMLSGGLENDPTIRQGRFSEESLPPRAKTAEETQALQGVLSAGAHLKKQTVRYTFLGRRDEVIWSLAAEAGLRESEIAGLKLTGIDFKTRYITVCGKGGHTGHVKVSQKLLSLLAGWLKTRPASAGEFVVCGWQGNGLSRSQVWRRVKAVGAAAGVEVSPHDLRHGFCLSVMRKALKDGLSPESALDVVRKQARHRDGRTSQMYLRASDNDLERVMEAL
jgi:site-specific recombinase XerD